MALGFKGKKNNEIPPHDWEGFADAPDIPKNSKGRVDLQKKYGIKTPVLDEGLSKKERKAKLKEIKQKRKELRKDLRLHGIKNKADFESFASEVGLDYPENTRERRIAGILSWFSAIWRWIRLRWTMATTMILALALLAATFIVAYISELKGQFTVNLTTDMFQDGFELFEVYPKTDDELDKNSKTRLYAKPIRNSNATSIYVMSRDVANYDGGHNGSGYMAYTFYVRNNGDEPTDYEYSVNILSKAMGADKAVWVMFFEDDKQIIYAKPQDNGEPESLWGYNNPPFYDEAYSPSEQYFQYNGLWGIETMPFYNDDIVVKGGVENFAPGDIKKYTIVSWIEGDDPDCTNDIMGGHMGLSVTFDKGEDIKEKHLLDGLYRTEYDEAFEGKVDPTLPEDLTEVQK